MHIPITEAAFPHEEGDEITIIRYGGLCVASYSDEEPDEFHGEAFGFGPCPLLAAADLVLQYPREVRQ